jgi:hypothetical protein
VPSLCRGAPVVSTTLCLRISTKNLLVPMRGKSTEIRTGTIGAVFNWGTKWDVSWDDITVMCSMDDRISLSFDTAWAPPIAFYDFLMSKGIKVNAIYLEMGVEYVGSYDLGFDDCYSLTNPKLPDHILEPWADYIYEYLDFVDEEENLEEYEGSRTLRNRVKELYPYRDEPS